MDVMTSTLAILAYGMPLSLMSVALWGINSSSPRQVFQVGRATTIGVFISSLLAAVVVFQYGALVTPLMGFNDIGLTLRLDALSVFICWLVAFLGIFIIQFSGNYLDGDERQALFLSRLYMTMGAVLFFVLAGNLWQMVIGWIGTSLALHQLLVFYGDRPRAIKAARKKFIMARMGDVCLIVATVLLWQSFGTVDLGEIGVVASQALASGSVPLAANIAAIFVVMAATLKSAMFPFHGWLLEVMETPTPVSALLHAGLLNAGIFLVVRFGELVFLSQIALALLIIIGGFTAIFASSAMITQSSVKVSLAYSSAAHMGFMLMLCGFGAHSVAIMHLVAHSFYKAHAFLSSGSAIEYVQSTGSQKLKQVPSVLNLLANLGISLVIFVGIATLLGIDLSKHLGEAALGIIFVMAVSVLLIRGTIGEVSLIQLGRSAVMAMAVTCSFFALELSAKMLLSNSVSHFPALKASTMVLIAVAVISFGTVTIAGTFLPAIEKSTLWQPMYVHLKNGFYANALFDRIVTRSFAEEK